MASLDAQGFQGRVARIEELIHAIDEIAEPSARAKARELVQTVLELHAAGLERMLEITDAAGASGEAIIEEMAGDGLVSNLLLLHGLHPLDLETRVRQALETVKPRLGQHGGSVEFLGVTPQGGVRLRLEGNCHGCPSSRVTLKYSIEEAIYASAPDVTALEVEGATEEVAAIPKYTECPLPNGAGAELEQAPI